MTDLDDALLAAHHRWLRSAGQDGERLQLMDADLRGLDLAGTDLREAWLDGSDLSGARLAGAWLVGARLEQCRLVGADLTGSRLAKVEASDVVATGVRLRGADLTRAVLYDADLSGADLSRAFLCKTVLKGADLRGALLVEADLDRTALDRAVIDDRTDLRDLGGTLSEGGLEVEGPDGRRTVSGPELLVLLRERGAGRVQRFEVDARVDVAPRWPLPDERPPAAAPS